MSWVCLTAEDEQNHEKNMNSVIKKHKMSKHVRLSELLVFGYIRKRNHFNIKLDIVAVSQLCLLYYGVYYSYFIFIGDHPRTVFPTRYDIQKNADHMWYHQIQSRNSLIGCFGYSGARPMTQYVDDEYQILKGGVMGHQWSLRWKGFVCFNIKSNTAHLIKTEKDEHNCFHLKISEEITAAPDTSRARQLGHGAHDEAYFKGKISQNAPNVMIYSKWQTFEDNLWNLFVTNRIYDENEKDIRKHQIWKIIQFISLIYFESEQKSGSAPIPTIIYSPKDKPERCFNHDMNDKMRMRFEDSMSSGQSGDDRAPVLMHKYKDFNFDTDLCAEILEYKKNEKLICKCYLYVNWGRDHRAADGCNENLYCAIFQIENVNNKVQIKLDFDLVKRFKIKSKMYYC